MNVRYPRALAAVACCVALFACDERTDTWVLDNVTIIDGTGSPAQPGMSLVVEGDRIVMLGPSDGVEAGRGVRLVDGSGLYVIPGLWDMHAHLTEAGHPALLAYVAYGVTGVREMGGDLEVIDAYRSRIASGELVGPRVVRAGPVVDGPKDAPTRIFVETAEDGRAAVRQLVELGVDHVKIHNAVPRDAFFTIAEEAARAGLPLVGHVPMTVHPDEATAAGMTSIEHIVTLFEGVLSAGVLDPLEQLAGLESFAEDGADAMAASFVAKGVWFTPTLYTYTTRTRRAELDANPAPEHKYVSAALRSWWEEAFPASERDSNPRVIEFRGRGDVAFAAVVARMHERGVRILTGTDLGARNVYPGSTVHDELAYLVSAAGLTPLEALRTATGNPAEYLGGLSNGGVSEGSPADFVVLSADPTQDIRNTRQIQAVVLGGQYLDRARLDEILAEAERLARE